MTLYGLPMAFLLPMWFILGAVIGSFLNVCIHRLPRHENVFKAWKGLVHPPSRCPRCFNRIRPGDNIPVLGWFLLRGRCRDCENPISFRYPFIEFLNGMLFVLLYWMEIPSGFPANFTYSCVWCPLGPAPNASHWWTSPEVFLHVRYFYHLVLVEALLVASFIDFDLKIIPDSVTLPAIVVGVVGAGVAGYLNLCPVWFQRPDLHQLIWLLDDGTGQTLKTSWLLPWISYSGNGVPGWSLTQPHLHGLVASLAGMVVGGGMVWVVRIIGQSVLRREAMGFGDVILMGMIGSYLGWQPTLLVFVIAPFCAVFFAVISWLFWSRQEIPYGPYLSLATLVVMLFWKQLWSYAELVCGMGPVLPVMGVLLAVGLYVMLQASQFLKWCLGMELYPEDEWESEWTSADQLAYLACEQVDPKQGQWKREETWPGGTVGRGQQVEETWRRGSQGQPGNGWQQQWRRRSVGLGD